MNKSKSPTIREIKDHHAATVANVMDNLEILRDNPGLIAEAVMNATPEQLKRMHEACEGVREVINVDLLP